MALEQILQPTTALEAINDMLASIGQGAVNSLENNESVDAASAIQILVNASRELQERGWFFNTDFNYPLSVDSNGEIKLPPGALQFEPDTQWRGRIVERSRKLYDRGTHSFIHAQGTIITGRVVWLLSFEDLPQAARTYIHRSAGRVFQEAAVGSDLVYRFTREREDEALAALTRAQLRADRPNAISDNAGVLYTAGGGRRRMSGGATSGYASGGSSGGFAAIPSVPAPTPSGGPFYATAINFTQPGSGMVQRTLQGKAADIIHADDRGLLGDGTTDETAALQQLFDAARGKVLMLGYAKSYGIDDALTIPANTTLIANGSKFKLLSALASTVTDSEFNITIGDDCDIDHFEVEAVGGDNDIGRVIVEGSRVRIGTLKVIAGATASGSAGSNWNAVRIGPNVGESNDIHIGHVHVENWDRPIVVQNLDRFSIDWITVENYRRGVYIKDVKHGVIHGGLIEGISPNSVGSAGDNGMLLEALSDYALDGLRVENVTISDSGEHGFRLGGQKIARNVWVSKCHVHASGSGSAATGGCGFKALGPTSVLGARHVNIHFADCSVSDIDLTGATGFSNYAAVQMGKVIHGSVSNFRAFVTPATGTYAETGNSCQNGVEIIGCQKVSVSNAMIQLPSNSGVYIYDFDDGVNDWGQTDDIDITGGHVNTPGDAGVEVVCGTITMRRISIQGFLAVNGGAYALKVVKSGTGAFVHCFASIRAQSPTVETFNGLGTDWTVTGQGSTLVGTSAAANGSTYQAPDTLKVRKAGAWASM